MKALKRQRASWEKLCLFCCGEWGSTWVWGGHVELGEHMDFVEHAHVRRGLYVGEHMGTRVHVCPAMCLRELHVCNRACVRVHTW